MQTMPTDGYTMHLHLRQTLPIHGQNTQFWIRRFIATQPRHIPERPPRSNHQPRNALRHPSHNPSQPLQRSLLPLIQLRRDSWSVKHDIPGSLISTSSRWNTRRLSITSTPTHPITSSSSSSRTLPAKPRRQGSPKRIVRAVRPGR